ncbi:MAG TPA: MogA/MoaB family molybdenum cofactor biosynthesis protein [Anaerolineaceae bacterium]|nr:MogA/MoaB family molybdenum cofactor biosynthesis protein [Anaerolineaceae bacterium]HPN50800.1 MogA/MoaB family molybdenum cofactor biosynthesis protein [Anaerolineaceae bacterium]
MPAIRVGILTLSDRSFRNERPDLSGPALVEHCQKIGWSVSKTAILPDDLAPISSLLIDWADSNELDLILTTGGTGFAPRDNTPEATLAVIHRAAPGLAEAMRSASLTITPHAMLSRAAAGIRNRTLIINLPGSPRAAIENLLIIQPVLPHAVQLLQEDAASEAGHAFQDKKKSEYGHLQP